MHRLVNNEYELRNEPTFKKDLKAITPPMDEFCTETYSYQVSGLEYLLLSL